MELILHSFNFISQMPGLQPPRMQGYHKKYIEKDWTCISIYAQQGLTSVIPQRNSSFGEQVSYLAGLPLTKVPIESSTLVGNFSNAAIRQMSRSSQASHQFTK
ncbi:UNVERIFIED_CONTAM: hypothetical protein Sangu_1775900 [Sesamum angustifolium]|uniref:Uncharacterized protein n=1 Tax=Sesamum angustifolium TaxID=2727405 RepID=A0AAW2M7T2_9LAMI